MGFKKLSNLTAFPDDHPKQPGTSQANSKRKIERRFEQERGQSALTDREFVPQSVGSAPHSFKYTLKF